MTTNNTTGSLDQILAERDEAYAAAHAARIEEQEAREHCFPAQGSRHTSPTEALTSATATRRAAIHRARAARAALIEARRA